MENRPFLSKLIFFNVSEHDYGNYTCVASNKLGHTNASITLFGETEPQARQQGAQLGGWGVGKDGGQGRESGVVRRGWQRRTGMRRERERAKQHGCESGHRVSFCTRSPDTAGKGLGDTEATLNFPPSISLTDCGDCDRI